MLDTNRNSHLNCLSLPAEQSTANNNEINKTETVC